MTSFSFKMINMAMIVSWLNFRLGVKACFYEGMDSYGKSWFTFFAPIYLMIITGVIMVLCRKSKRIARLFRNNIVKVLATLIQLCYTKLIQSVVVALSFTIIKRNGEEKNKMVWLQDPEVEYFAGKHIPLALVGILFGILIVMYTLILLFIKPLQQYSHLCLFSWVAKFKPLIDAYTAPHIIKDEYRYWEGLLLLFRMILAIVFASNVKSEIDINLNVISTSSVLLLTIAWCTGGIYKKRYLNILNSLSIFNLAFVSIGISYVIGKSPNFKNLKDDKLYNQYVGASLIMAMALLFSILLYYIIIRFKSCCSKCKRLSYATLDTAEDVPFMSQFPRQDDSSEVSLSNNWYN